jgi:hypothetical protein
VQGPPSALLQANKVSVAAQGAREQVVTSDDIYGRCLRGRIEAGGPE